MSGKSKEDFIFEDLVRHFFGLNNKLDVEEFDVLGCVDEYARECFEDLLYFYVYRLLFM